MATAGIKGLTFYDTVIASVCDWHNSKWGRQIWLKLCTQVSLSTRKDSLTLGFQLYTSPRKKSSPRQI